MINDAQGSHTHQLLLGLLFIVFILAVQPGVPKTSEGKSGEELAAPFLATSDYRRKFRDQKDSKSQFDVRSIEEWERSVVSIGSHDPGCGEFSWLPHRTGFAVRSRETQGQLIATGDIRTLPHSADRFRVHAHPFSLPPGPFAQRAMLAGTGGLSFVRITSGAWIPPVKLVDWASARYEQRFPVVLIGFHDGELIHFFTHSIGRSESKGRVRLENRPPVEIGEFVGAAVSNKDGFVGGVYSPDDHRPTYLSAAVLRSRLNRN